MSVVPSDLVLYGASLQASGDGIPVGSGISFSTRIGFTDVASPTTLLYASSVIGNAAVTGIVSGLDSKGLVQVEQKTFSSTTPVAGAKVFQQLFSGQVSGSVVGDLAIIASASTVIGIAQSAAQTTNTTAPQIVLQSGQGALVSVEQIIRITNNSPAGAAFQLRRIVDISGDTCSVNEDWGTLPTSATSYSVSNGMLFERLPNSITQVTRLFVNTKSQLAQGNTNTYYSKFFAVNNNLTTALASVSIGLVSTNPSLPNSSTLQLGVAAGFNDTQAIPSRLNSAPPGITFTTGSLPVSQPVAGLGNLMPGNPPNIVNCYGVWAKLTLPAGTSPINDYITLTVSGTAADAPIATPLSAIVAISGGPTVTFNQADGVDQGNYVDPLGRFTQQCVLTTSSAIPMSVYFRPDLNSDRAEVVFELGQVIPDAGVVPANMGTYTATIMRGTQVLSTTSVPKHFWFSRWRWQSSPRPVTASVGDLIASGLIPNYDASVLGRFTVDDNAHTYAPMGLAGLDNNMGDVGERGDIGPITEWQADFVCRGTLLSTVLAQAEAAGTISMHFRDPATGGPIDILTDFPKAQARSGPTAGVTPVLYQLGVLADGVVQYDDGHSPALSYLPFLLTGDPYYLEEMQFQAQMDILVVGPNGRFVSRAGRYYAWSLRNSLHATKCTPASVPRWLKSNAYCQSLVTQYLNVATSWTTNPDSAFSVFHLTSLPPSGSVFTDLGLPPGGTIALWQDDFVTFVVGWAVLLGYSEWNNIMTYKTFNTIFRTNGTSGWPRAAPSPYEAAMLPGANLTAAMAATDTSMSVDAPWLFPAGNVTITVAAETLVATIDPTAFTWPIVTRTNPVAHGNGAVVLDNPARYATWPDFINANLTLKPYREAEGGAASDYFAFMPGDPTGMNQLYTLLKVRSFYHSYCRGALLTAIKTGIVSAQDPFTWIDGQMKAALSNNYSIQLKWCIV